MRDVGGYRAIGDRRWAFVSAGLLACAPLGGCGASMSDFTTSSVASYQPASFFSPNGYSVSANADGSLHVTASGAPATPTARLEKIALARAAEYGNEQHLKAFTATPPQVSIKCGKTKLPSKDGPINVKPLDYRVVSVDVTYGSDLTDPRAKGTRETAETLKAELAAEIVPPDVQAAATQAVAQQCGR